MDTTHTNNINPSPNELIQHLKQGGHIKYASVHYVNDVKKNQLLDTASGAILIYQIKSEEKFFMKRMKFGTLATINFKLEYVELLPIGEHAPYQGF